MIHKDALASLAWRKSSYSGGGGNGGADCIEVAPLTGLAWQTSSLSGGGGDGGANCVEWARLHEGGFAVRDSKNPAAGVLLLPRAGMAALLGELRRVV